MLKTLVLTLLLISTHAQAQKAPKLPAPDENASKTKMSKIIGWPKGKTPKAPAGFQVIRFAEKLGSPRWMYELPNGDILVAEAQTVEKNPVKIIGAKITGADKSHTSEKAGNQILIFRDSNKDGTYEVRETFLSGLNQPFGMLLIKDFFYVANTDAVWRYPYKSGSMKITGAGQKILDLPEGGRHWTRNIVSNRSGTKIYVAVGSASNVAESGIDKETRRADILEIDPDGKNERIFASGLRNPVGMDWISGTDTLWTAVNERDELGDDLVPDYITSVKEGGFYGWPYTYFGTNPDPRMKGEMPEIAKRSIVPDMAVGSHTASLGLAFYNQKSFPDKYHGGAFIGQHGSWNRSQFSGYKVAFVPFKNGRTVGEMEDFLTDFIANESKGEVYGRPVGVTVLKNGNLLVADDGGNIIWEVRRQ